MISLTPEEAWSIAADQTSPPVDFQKLKPGSSFLEYCYYQIAKTAADCNETDLRWRTCTIIKRRLFREEQHAAFRALEAAGYRVITTRQDWSRDPYDIAIIQFWRGE